MSALLARKTAFGLLVALILVTTAGNFLAANMMMEDGVMHNCPYMGLAGLCDMTPIQHVSEWQAMFVTTIQEFATAALLLLLALTIFWNFARYLFVPKYREVRIARYRCRERVFDPFKLAFARGIIHTKAF